MSHPIRPMSNRPSMKKNTARQPKPISSKRRWIDVRVDLFPEERKAEYAATVELTNLSEDPIDRLYLNVDSHTTISVITLQHQPLACLEKDAALGMSVYELPDPIHPGTNATLFIEAMRNYHGFTQTAEEPQADLAANGLFFTEPIPYIGFDLEKTLQDNRDREIHHLKKLSSRLAPIDDRYGLHQGFVSPWISSEDGKSVHITVSTPDSQQPFAPEN